jgi:hypothetical protein
VDHVNGTEVRAQSGFLQVPCFQKAAIQIP